MATPPPTTTTTPIFISTTTLQSILTHKTLINHLKTTLPNATTSLTTPPRHSLSTSQNSTLLLMPSFSTSPSLPYIGVKLVTSHPHNSSLNLPTINSNYTLFDSLTGQTLALFDANDLTLFRTSSISALASSFLSNPSSQTLVIIGAGQLSPHLITAHLTTRPMITKVFIFNRTHEKAVALVTRMKRVFENVSFECCVDMKLDEVIGLADIVCCATNSDRVLVKGEWLKKGAHVDLVGSFMVSMRECDDEAIRRGRVFVDNEIALEEAGELVGAFERGVIRKEDVCGDLVGLINGEVVGRRDESEITVFKSVGSGVVDLLTAHFVYDVLMKGRN